MSATAQPVWKYLANYGDVTFLDYGGYFVFQDETGKYGVECELLEVDESLLAKLEDEDCDRENDKEELESLRAELASAEEQQMRYAHDRELTAELMSAVKSARKELAVFRPRVFRPEDGDNRRTPYTVYRFCADRCTYVNGVLSDNEFHPDYPVWFADKLGAVAQSAGEDEDELREALCAADPLALARAYQSLILYFGPHEFDSYPLQLTRDEAQERYKDISGR
jgi:hypothetical protein